MALVHLDDEGDATAYCAGVWVGALRFLTAAHCVGEGTVEYAIAGSDVVHKGTVVGKNGHDLALVLDMKAPVHPWAKLRTPRPGTKAHAMGHPLGLWWSYSQGDVSAVRRWSVGSRISWWVQATTAISKGSSGGGLFDDDGNLIGVTSGYLSAGQNLNMFVHPDYVQELLDQ